MTYDSGRLVVVAFGGFGTTSAFNDTWEYDGTTWTPGGSAPGGLTPRAYHAMAYDSDRDCTVLFGGFGGAHQSDTWEYDGSWNPGPSAPVGLVPRAFHGMAYDAARGVSVVFGGHDGTAYRRDTWEYDGTTWAQGPVPPAGLVERQVDGAMAFDGARGVTVIYGGYSTGMRHQDTWEYDGIAWSRGPDGLKPRYAAAMAFDSLRGLIVIYGGTEMLHVDDTEEYDGATWRYTGGQAPPPSRHEHAMAFDAARERVVLFGGGDDVGVLGDTWVYDGVSWVQGAAAPPGLTPRKQHAMSFDTARGRVVLFGGEDAGGRRNDTWEFDGAAWSAGAIAPGALAPRSRHAQSYDSANGSTVLFGGDDGAPLGDTWLYDGVAWSLGPTGPVARSDHAMAFDARRARTVLFGGVDAGGAELSDTWERGNGGWLGGPGAPAGLGTRANHFMVFDGVDGVITLHQGTRGPSDLSGTWMYDGIGWTEANVWSSMSRRGLAGAFDSTRGRVVMFGGQYSSGATNLRDTWEYDGGGWLERPPRMIGFTARAGHAAVFDASRNRLMVFGGEDGHTLRADTWVRSAITGWGEVIVGPGALTPRAQHAMAYDLASATAVLFGGSDGGGLRNDTWVYGSSGWMPGPAAPAALTARAEHAMAYDVSRSRVVLFGGRDGALRNDTWELVGGSWLSGASAPGGLTPRRGHAMAYDVSRGRVVLFGGDDGVARKDTWELSAGGWSAGASAPAALGARWGHTLAFDGARGLSILFGGTNGTTRLGDTWEYNGASWSRGSTEPYGLRPREEHAMVYDSSRATLMMLGGTDGEPRGDVWEYQCPTISVAPASIPSGQVGVAYAVTFTATGGWAPYTFAVTSGALPLGLTLAPSGALSGTPAQGGTFGFSVTAIDATGCSRASAYTLPIACYTVTVLPFSLPVGTVGNAYAATITAVGGLPPYTFAVTSGALPAGLALVSDGTLSGTPSLVGSYSFTVEATDGATCKGNRAYLLSVQCGSLTLSPTSLPGAFVGQSYGQTISASGGSPPYSFSVTAGAVPPGLALSGGGVLSGTPTAPGVYGFTVTVTDAAGCAGSWGYSVAVTCSTITLSPATLPTGAVGVPYAETIVATGGAPPYTYGVTSGSLPPGLSLSSTSGTLSGTPTTPGTYALTVSAIDSAGCAGSIGYNVVIFNCGTIVLAPAALPDGALGTPYSQTITASGGVSPYTFAVTAGGLPPGLGLTTNGLLSGTPGAPGTYSFTVLATDANSCSGSHAYQLRVTCGGLVLSPPTLPDGVVATPYAVTITASGGLAPYTFSMASGTLPPGLALAASGVLSGVPSAAGSFGFTVRARDATGCEGTRAYVVAVSEGIDYVVGQGLGQPNGNRVRVYDATGAATAVDFFAYGAGQWGVNVASGELTGPVPAEMLTGPGPGEVFGPQVKAFDRFGAALGKVNFYAYATLKYGVNPASGGVDGDAYAEILTGPGPGAVFGPHVRGWNFDGAALAAIAKINFFAYGTLKYGVNVASGDVDGDGYAELLTGPGPGPAFGAQVRGFDYDGAAVTAVAKLNYAAFSGALYGASVAGGDVEGDGFDEILASRGAGPAEPASFVGHDFDGAALGPLPGFATTPFTTTFGSRVGAAGVGGDGSDDLLAGAGRDPAADSRVMAFDYDGAALAQVAGSFVPFGTAGYGVNVAGGALGY